MWPFNRRHSSTYDRRDTGINMLPRWTAPPARNTEEWIRYFKQSPRLAVVERIASDLSFATGKLYRVDDAGKEQEILQHPFLTLLKKPNPLHEMTSAAIWRLFDIYMLLKGEGYFLIERNLLGQPVELWPVPVHWVQATPYEGFPYFQIRITSGNVLSVPVEDLFTMKDLDPFNPYMRGMGQSEQIADEIEIDEYAAKFQKNFFFNDAASGTVLCDPNMTAPQRDRLQEEWQQNFGGVRNSHRLHIVKGVLTALKLTDNMKDMDMIQGRTSMRNAVLEHYGVPREIMGITESSNRATSEAAQFIYAQNVLMPKLRRREEAINTQLLPLFGSNLIWRFDDIIPHDREFNRQTAMEGWNSGLITRNQALKLLDMGEIKNGDVYKTSYSDIFVKEDTDLTELGAGIPEGGGSAELEDSGI